MFKHGDPTIKKHMDKVKKLEQKYPNRNWKTNLSQIQVNELADDMGESEAKKQIDPLLNWLIESEQIK